MEPAPSSDEWPLHERLGGAATRAVLAGLGFALPFVFIIPLKDALLVLGGAIFATATIFLPERRDASLARAGLNLLGAGAFAGLAFPFAGIWFENLGRPERAFDRIGQFLETNGVAFLLVAPYGAALAFSIGLPILLRTRTTSVQALAGAMVALAAGPAMVALQDRVAVGLCVMLAFLLAGAGVVLGDRLAVRFDPHAPKPVGGPLSKAWLLWCPFALVGLCLVVATQSTPLVQRGTANEASAKGTLRAVRAAQTIFRDEDKDVDGVHEYAGSLKELEDADIIDKVLGSGVQRGYLFRLTRSATTSEFLWAAAADPAVPGKDTGARYFFTNQSGVIYYTTSGPAAFTDDCSPPPGWLEVGR
jgi:hypothetical protein